MNIFGLNPAPTVPRTQRHQLHWVLADGEVVPNFTCLHGDLPPHYRCDAEVFREEPESLALGHIPTMPIRDGIILTYWNGGHATPWNDDDGAELVWSYEEAPGPLETQHHLLHFTVSEHSHLGLTSPNFVCLHKPMERCHSTDWAEDGSLFPEWYAGPAGVPARAGAIVSWWPDSSSEESLPSWAYEEHASEALTESMSGAKR